MDQVAELLYVLVPSFAVLLVLCCCISYCREARRETEERNAAELARWLAAAAAAAAPPDMKKKLVCFPYSAPVEGGGTAASDCAICLEVFVHGATCSEVPACRHLFHQVCIELWMKSNSTCPLCRADIVPGSEPLSAAEDIV